MAVKATVLVIRRDVASLDPEAGTGVGIKAGAVVGAETFEPVVVDGALHVWFP